MQKKYNKQKKTFGFKPVSNQRPTAKDTSFDPLRCVHTHNLWVKWAYRYINNL